MLTFTRKNIKHSCKIQYSTKMHFFTLGTNTAIINLENIYFFYSQVVLCGYASSPMGTFPGEK